MRITPPKWLRTHHHAMNPERQASTDDWSGEYHTPRPGVYRADRSSIHHDGSPPVTGARPAILKQRKTLHGAAAYAAAALATFAALGASLLFLPYISRVLFIFFWPAVLGSAVIGGFGPGLLCSVLSVLVVDYWLILPNHQSSPGAPSDLMAMGIFVAASSVVSMLAERRLRAEERAHAALRENAQLVDQLEQQTSELESQVEESQALTEELELASTDLMERSAEAEEAAAYSRGILESITDPFVVHDADWRFRYANEAASRVFAGSSHPEAATIVGRVMWDVYVELEGTPIAREMRRAARDRVPVQFEAFYPERGTWLQMSCYPLPDGGLATQWKNITSRKKAEEAAHYLDRATRLLMAPMDPELRLADLARLVVPDFADWCSIDMLDEPGKLRQVAVAHVDPSKTQWARELNEKYPAKLDAPTGVPNVLRTGAPELYAQITDEMLVAGAIDEEHLHISRELGLRSAMVVPLATIGAPFGTLTLVSAESRRRYTSDDLVLAGELARRAAFAVDNARQHQRAREAQQAAEAANLAKSQFLAAMSHELRTPLNAIAGYVDLLLIGLHGAITAQQQTDLERVQKAQRHLMSLITDILNFARLEAGHVEVRLSPTPVSQVLSDLRIFVDPQLGERSLTLRCEQPKTDVAVRVDIEKTRQILLNLISNSVKFTPRGGQIDITCVVASDVVEVRVTDSGIGIPTDRLESVFEPFVQVHRSLKEPTGGVGLGLAISRDLARAMGGDLRVNSTEGVGSTFSLTLQRADTPAVSA